MKNKNKQKVFNNQLIIFTTHNSNIKNYYNIYNKINYNVLKYCEQNEIPIHNKHGSIKQKYLLSEVSKKKYVFIDYIKDNKKKL